MASFTNDGDLEARSSLRAAQWKEIKEIDLYELKKKGQLNIAACTLRKEAINLPIIVFIT